MFLCNLDNEECTDDPCMYHAGLPKDCDRRFTEATEKAQPISSTEFPCSATGEEIVEMGCEWLENNQNTSVCYSMTIGYWNSLIFMLNRWGFKIVSK